MGGWLIEDFSITGCRGLLLFIVLEVAVCWFFECKHHKRFYAWLKQMIGHNFKVFLAQQLQRLALALNPPALTEEKVEEVTETLQVNVFKNRTRSLQEQDRKDSAISLNSSISEGTNKKHKLFVCTKCNKCPSENDLFQGKNPSLCRLGGTPDNTLGDMEDMIQSVKSGELLFKKMVKTCKRRVEAKRKHVLDDLEIVPVSCLSACSQTNVIALSAEGKYTYQFGGICERDDEQIDHALDFVENWMLDEKTGGYSKSKQRPAKIRTNCLARVPPI